MAAPLLCGLFLTYHLRILSIECRIVIAGPLTLVAVSYVDSHKQVMLT